MKAPILDTTQSGSYHLASSENIALYEIQRTNNFEFVVMDVDNLLRAGVKESTADDTDYIKNAQNVLRFSVVSFTEPHFSQNPIEIRRGNTVMKAAGVPTFDNGSLVVNDYIGADTKSALMAWQNLSYNVKTEKVGRMADYKKTCFLCEYTPDYQLVRTWRLLGCWVSALSASEFNMEQNDKKTITATISFDKAFMEMPNEE